MSFFAATPAITTIATTLTHQLKRIKIPIRSKIGCVVIQQQSNATVSIKQLCAAYLKMLTWLWFMGHEWHCSDT